MVDEAGGCKTTKIGEFNTVFVDLGKFSTNNEARLQMRKCDQLSFSLNSAILTAAWNLLLYTLLAILLSYLFTFYDFRALHHLFDQNLHESPFYNFLQSSNFINPLVLSFKPRSRVYPFDSVDSTTACKNIPFVAVSIPRDLLSTFGSSVNYFFLFNSPVVFFLPPFSSRTDATTYWPTLNCLLLWEERREMYPFVFLV